MIKNNKDKIKILNVFFSNSASGYRKGWNRFDIFTGLLRKKDCEVWILGYLQNWKNNKEKLFGKIHMDYNNKIINLTQPRWIDSIDVIFNNLGFLGGFAYALMMHILCKKFNFKTIILADDMSGTNFYFLIINKLLFLKINTIIDYQDLTARMHTYKSKNKIRRIIEILLDEVINPKFAGKLITITEYGKNYLAMRSGVKKIFVLPNICIVNSELILLSKELIRKELGLPLDKKIIVWSGFLGGQTTKDVFLLLKAITLTSIKDNIMVVIIGETNNVDSKILKTYADKHKLNLIFTGYLPSDGDLYWKYLRAADIGVFLRPNSDYAHFLTGRKVVDFISVGLPVIVPCLKGQLETIKGNGICYIPEDAKDLAEKINEIFKLDLNLLSQKSIEIAEKFLSPEVIETKIEKEKIIETFLK